MPDTEKIVEIFGELRNFADNEVHPVVSPENWHVYSKLHDLIDQAETDAVAMLKEQEVKAGKWIPIESPTGVEAFGIKEMTVINVRCSVCGSEEDVSFTGYKYCPRCGAKMEGQ